MKPPIVAPIPVDIRPDNGSSVISEVYAPRAPPASIEAVLVLNAIFSPVI
jgi:hypothetical protein